jgi:hypothetical protein
MKSTLHGSFIKYLINSDEPLYEIHDLDAIYFYIFHLL